MIVYYRETNDYGDYLAIDDSLKRTEYGNLFYDGRATAIAVQVGSISSTSINSVFLYEKCKQVRKKEVPLDWLRAIGLE